MNPAVRPFSSFQDVQDRLRYRGVTTPEAKLAHEWLRDRENELSVFFQSESVPGSQAGRSPFEQLRVQLEEFALGIFNRCVESPERTLALRHIETARMAGNECILLATSTNAVSMREDMITSNIYTFELRLARYRASQAVAFYGTQVQEFIHGGET